MVLRNTVVLYWEILYFNTWITWGELECRCHNISSTKHHKTPQKNQLSPTRGAYYKGQDALRGNSRPFTSFKNELGLDIWGLSEYTEVRLGRMIFYSEYCYWMRWICCLTLSAFIVYLHQHASRNMHRVPILQIMNLVSCLYQSANIKAHCIVTAQLNLNTSWKCHIMGQTIDSNGYALKRRQGITKLY